jgi:protein-S-isoprenylcysteine O-methyltransferase Ste14
VAQIGLMGLLFAGPRTLGGLPAWPVPFPRASWIAGGILAAAGGVLFLAAVARLGRRLTPLPYPKPGGTLIQSGPYAIVRHPIYTGGLLVAFGWALAVRGWLTLGCAVALFLLLDVKSRREERWLVERHPEYRDYQRHVRRLVPYLY